MPIDSIIAKKSLGVLMHPTCIPGGKVCGTFGKGAKEWIKKLHKHGIEYWQFLPLTPTDSTGIFFVYFDSLHLKCFYFSKLNHIQIFFN